MRELTLGENIAFIVGLVLVVAQYVALIWLICIELRREMERYADEQERKNKQALQPYAEWQESLRESRAAMELLVSIDLNLAKLKALQIRLHAAAQARDVEETERLLAKMERIQGEIEAAFDMLERPKSGVEASQDRLKALLTERYIMLSRLDEARMRGDIVAETVIEAELILVEQQLNDMTQGGLP